MDISDKNPLSNEIYIGELKNKDEYGRHESNICDKVILRTSLKKKIPVRPTLDKSNCPSDKDRKKRVSFTDLFANVNKNDFAHGQDLDDKDEKWSFSEDSNEKIHENERNIESEYVFTKRKNQSNGISIRNSDNRRSFDFMIIQPPTPPNARHSMRTRLIE